MTHYCPRCRRKKPAAMFYQNKSAANGLQGYCKLCLGAYSTQRYKRLRAEKAAAEAAKREAFVPLHGAWIGDGNERRPVDVDTDFQRFYGISSDIAAIARLEAANRTGR